MNVSVNANLAVNRIPIGRLKSEMQTKIFLESLKKIDAPQTLKDIRENIEWSKIGELIKI